MASLERIESKLDKVGEDISSLKSDVRVLAERSSNMDRELGDHKARLNSHSEAIKDIREHSHKLQGFGFGANKIWIIIIGLITVAGSILAIIKP